MQRFLYYMHAVRFVLYILLVSYSFWTISVGDPNESFKTFLTLVEVIQVTNSFLYKYMELEDYHFEEN